MLCVQILVDGKGFSLLQNIQRSGLALGLTIFWGSGVFKLAEL